MGESPKQINQSPEKLQTEGSVAELVKSFDSSSFSKVLTIRHGGTFSFRYKIGH